MAATLQHWKNGATFEGTSGRWLDPSHGGLNRGFPQNT